MDGIQICSSEGLTLDLQNGKRWIIFRINNSSYLLSFQMVHYALKTMLLSDGTNKYICGLYRSKLKDLFSIIATKQHFNFPKQWLCIYQISSFFPKDGKRYKVEELSYGLDVVLQIDKHFHLTIVSNCLGFKEDYFYFLQDLSIKQKDKEIGVLFNKNAQKYCGISFSMCGELICIPSILIVAGLSPKLKIEDDLMYYLKKTVYLQLRGSHCTGTLISQTTILTVRHIFSTKIPEIGTQLNLKIYPYSQTTKAKLIRIYTQQIDLVLLTVVLSSITYQSEIIQYNQIVHQIGKNYELSLGEDIKAIGFGRFDYSIQKLSQIDVILPTISRGIVSKIICADKIPVLFKTDASLHHGFSGCGIWSRKSQKGVAAFIIKNTTNSSELTKQNFSYLISFISKNLLKNSLQIAQNILETIKNMGNFGVRSQMRIFPSL